MRLVDRVRRIGLGAALMFVCVSTASAQVFDTEALGQETLWSDFFGSDARAMAMGNTGLAFSHDGSAMIYNPANLAKIKRIEFRAGLSHQRLANDTRLLWGGQAFTDDRNLNKTRINALSLTVPVPTYRGSLVFGFGLHRINSFDRAFGVLYDELGTSGVATDRGRELETGGIWKWTAGGAVDISPRLSTGMSLHLLTGKDDYQWNREDNRTANTITEDQTINLDYVGVSATAGLTYAISPVVSAALTLETPTYLAVEENARLVVDTLDSEWQWYDETTSNYQILRPLAFGLGLAASVRQLNILGDLRYTDWTQLDFSYDDPALKNDEAAAKRFIQDNLTEVLGVNIGAEYLIPDRGVTLRAGYFRDPLPVDARFIESQRQYVTAGVGLLIDRVMTLDLAYVQGGYELRNDDPGTYFAKYKTRRAFVTFGYRI
ncbi:MAG: hypothetical protein AB1792_00060 [Candidatus Zixiibacteriota bacterium]